MSEKPTSCTGSEYVLRRNCFVRCLFLALDRFAQGRVLAPVADLGQCTDLSNWGAAQGLAEDIVAARCQTAVA